MERVRRVLGRRGARAARRSRTRPGACAGWRSRARRPTRGRRGGPATCAAPCVGHRPGLRRRSGIRRSRRSPRSRPAGALLSACLILAGAFASAVRTDRATRAVHRVPGRTAREARPGTGSHRRPLDTSPGVAGRPLPNIPMMDAVRFLRFPRESGRDRPQRRPSGHATSGSSRTANRPAPSICATRRRPAAADPSPWPWSTSGFSAAPAA